MKQKTVLFKYNVIKGEEVKNNPDILKNPNLDRITHITDDVVKYIEDSVIEENKVVPDITSYVKGVCDKDRIPVAYTYLNNTKGFKDLVGKKAIEYVNDLQQIVSRESNRNVKVYHNLNEDDVIEEDRKYYLVVLDNGDVCFIKEHGGNIKYLNKVDKFILLDYIRMIDLTPQIEEKNIDLKTINNKLVYRKEQLEELRKILDLPEDLDIEEGKEAIYVTTLNIPENTDNTDKES